MAVTNDPTASPHGSWRWRGRSRCRPKPRCCTGCGSGACSASRSARRVHRVALPGALGELVRPGHAGRLPVGEDPAAGSAAVVVSPALQQRAGGARARSAAAPRRLDGGNGRPRAGARRPRSAAAAVATPDVPRNRTHVFYQYAIYANSRDDVVRRCLRRGDRRREPARRRLHPAAALRERSRARTRAPSARQPRSSSRCTASLTTEGVRRVASVVSEVVAST